MPRERKKLLPVDSRKERSHMEDIDYTESLRFAFCSYCRHWLARMFFSAFVTVSSTRLARVLGGTELLRGVVLL
jgi:hypothetical protein